MTTSVTIHTYKFTLCQKLAAPPQLLMKLSMVLRSDSHAWLKLTCLPDQMPRADPVVSTHTTFLCHAKLGATYVWSSHTECHKLATTGWMKHACLPRYGSLASAASHHASVSAVSFAVALQSQLVQLARLPYMCCTCNKNAQLNAELHATNCVAQCIQHARVLSSLGIWLKTGQALLDPGKGITRMKCAVAHMQSLGATDARAVATLGYAVCPTLGVAKYSDWYCLIQL